VAVIVVVVVAVTVVLIKVVVAGTAVNLPGQFDPRRISLESVVSPLTHKFRDLLQPHSAVHRRAQVM